MLPAMMQASIFDTKFDDGNGATAADWHAYFDEHAYDVDGDWYYARLINGERELLGDATALTATTFGLAKGDVRGPVLTKILADKGHCSIDELRKVVTPTNQSTFLTIQPPFSFAQLPISLEMLWRTLSLLAIFPGIFDVLHLFGQKTDEVNEDYAVFRQHYTPPTAPLGSHKASFEVCYNFKWVEKRRSLVKESEMIWTTRKIGVYAKREPTESRSTWILIQPGAKSFMDRVIKRLRKAGTAHMHDLEIHLLFMKAASQNWTEYLNDLDTEFRRLETKVFLWRSGATAAANPAPHDPPPSGLEIPDTQRVQHYKVKLHNLSHALEINCANIQALRRTIEVFRLYGGGSGSYVDDEDQIRRYDQELNELHIQTVQHDVRVKNLVRCSEDLFSLVCTLASSILLSRQWSRSELTCWWQIPYMFAQTENGLMLRLSEKATEYAKSMKVITVVCMFYLPPSLVAGVLTLLNLFDGGSGGTSGKLVGVFIAATAVLFVVTWALLAMLSWRWRRRPEGEDFPSRNRSWPPDLEKCRGKSE